MSVREDAAPAADPPGFVVQSGRAVTTQQMDQMPGERRAFAAAAVVDNGSLARRLCGRYRVKPQRKDERGSVVSGHRCKLLLMSLTIERSTDEAEHKMTPVGHQLLQTRQGFGFCTAESIAQPFAWHEHAQLLCFAFSISIRSSTLPFSPSSTTRSVLVHPAARGGGLARGGKVTTGKRTRRWQRHHGKGCSREILLTGLAGQSASALDPKRWRQPQTLQKSGGKGSLRRADWSRSRMAGAAPP
ncbi:hypothetical protein BD289DRAFT_89576 [Coniella lustricola]|uniref:Uncharacterized protein n=1 Tax=Coniella lustricola TaxID=2025994 RepID=A0A2T2ZYM4_9PEZI|nr:hypothetical protein BD289DRAFT_89576 [Coniella lustricola]